MLNGSRLVQDALRRFARLVHCEVIQKRCVLLILFADASFERFRRCWFHDSVGASIFGFLLTGLLGDINKMLPDDRKRLYQQD